jgi:hypothetical protein
MRWIGGNSRRAELERNLVATPSDQLNVQRTLQALPTLIDSSSLPNGIVELVIEDFDASTRQLFDIHDGHITLVEPGQCVPWASIAGSAIAWTTALGPEHNLTALQITGDKQLAQRVLAALPQRD